MANQLLATFYVQSPEFLYGDVTVTAQVQYQSGNSWYSDNDICVIDQRGYTNDKVDDASYTDATGQKRYRYKINVYRREEYDWDSATGQQVYYYRLNKAGTYKRKLVVTVNGSYKLERMIYLTIQPDVQVFVDDIRAATGRLQGERVDLVTTTETTLSQNPLQKQKTVNIVDTAGAVAARTINLTEPNEYKGTVFVKSNLPVDLYSNDVAGESGGNGSSEFYDVWLRLQNKIRLTRKVGSSEYKWNDGYGYYPFIKTDTRGKYATFIHGDNSGYDTALLDYPYYGAVALGLEKPLLEMPLCIESLLTLYGREVSRYTGTGETVENTPPVVLPLLATLKTHHAVKILPDVITLDEDNNYTSFVTVEANDGADWTFAPVDSRITVTPSSGTGRAAVVVKKATSFNLGNNNFINVPLTIVSTVDAMTYPSIDGNYTVSDTAAVHLEQYTPEHNALIPRMDDNYSDSCLLSPLQSTQESWGDEVWKAFAHSLSLNGIAGRCTQGMYPSSGVIDLENLGALPGVEVEFDTPHRIRSWSLQSVGRVQNEVLATGLVLQGRGLDGTWKILDVVQTRDSDNGQQELYSERKIRLDRAVPFVELVDKIRVIAAMVVNNWSGGIVQFPQIQVFTGVPVLPKMQSDNQDGVTVRSNGGTMYDDYYGTNRDAGIRVFDREVSGNGIATIGSRAWYINNNHFLLEDVAENGNISQFGSYQSKGWLALVFPRTRLLGYLYSIDNLLGRSDNHANVSYAASLYFEGRRDADTEAVLAPSAQWDFIDLISLDNCLGHKEFGVSTTALIAEANQATLNTYVQNLLSALPSVSSLLSPDSFLMNRFDKHIIRYNGTTEQWYDDGLRLEPGTTATSQFNNLTTAQLLAEAGQARLNSVALTRGQSMQPPWSSIPDKATIVNQKDDKRMMYDLSSGRWSEVPNNDAIYRVHNRTHYADLKDTLGHPLLLAQLRCTVQSIMNTERPSVGGEPVAMPEMQFFGLPADTINANANAVATVSYLKAEDAAGNLYDVLGKRQRLPYKSFYSGWYYGYTTTFRFYIGTVQNIKSSDKRLYLTIQNTSGTLTTQSVNIEDNYSSTPYREISVSGDCRTMCYFELYIYSANNEKIILANGYTGERRQE